MQDDVDKKQQEVKEIQEELRSKRLSRRGLLHRLKGVGLGFGAVVVLGVEAGAHGADDATASLKSTNSVLNDIIEEGRQSQVDDDGKAVADPKGALEQDAYLGPYRRFYFRGYRRIYYRYSRFYPRIYRRF